MGKLGVILVYSAFIALILASLMEEVEGRRTILRGRKTITRSYMRDTGIPAWAICVIVGVCEIIVAAIVYLVLRAKIVSSAITYQDKMDLSKFYGRLKLLLRCPVCAGTYSEPVRLLSCRHSMCLKCLDPSSSNCPVCQLPYESGDKTMKSLHSESILKLKQFQVLLEESVSWEYEEQKFMVVFYDKMKLNAKGESSLHLACKKKPNEETKELVKRLVKESVDLNCRDFGGWTALHECVERNHVETARILLENGALSSVAGAGGVTPLHDAIARGFREMVELLMEFGADCNVKDLNGRTPMDLAGDNFKYCFVKRPLNLCFNLYLPSFITVYCHSIFDAYKGKLETSARANVVQTFDLKRSPVTHFVIKKTHNLSLKILIALAAGLFFVPQEWVDQFLQGFPFINVPKYEFVLNASLNESIVKAMMNSLLKRPNLFENINFYVTDHLEGVKIYGLHVDQGFLQKLIASGGGCVLKRAPSPSTQGSKVFPFHANRNTNNTLSCCSFYIIYEEARPPTLQYRMDDLKHNTSKWLIDCVLNFSITS